MALRTKPKRCIRSTRSPTVPAKIKPEAVVIMPVVAPGASVSLKTTVTESFSTWSLRRSEGGRADGTHGRRNRRSRIQQYQKYLQALAFLLHLRWPALTLRDAVRVDRPVARMGEALILPIPETQRAVVHHYPVLYCYPYRRKKYQSTKVFAPW